MSLEPFLGEIQMVAFPFAPVGFALCDGSLLQVSQYPALYSLIGVAYGGDGVQTFAIPDLRGRGPISVGAGPGLQPVHIGQKGGLEAVTLTADQLPSHTHTATVQPGAHAQQSCSTSLGTIPSPAGAIPAEVFDIESGAVVPAFAPPAAANQTMAPLPLTLNISVSATGGSKPVETRSPYLGVYYVIALEGVFPSRG
jgi:microcystin-dependent protein